MFAKTAKQKGKVVSVKPQGVIIEYEDGSQEGLPVGKQYGKSGALVFPHELVTHLKEGQTVEPGDVLTYNENFFKRDYLNTKGVVWKSARPMMVALLEDASTYEDSSSVSRKTADAFSTSTTVIKPITVAFDQVVHSLVKPGQKVSSDDHLCLIEESVTTDTGLFDADTLDTLRALAAQSPRSGTEGVVDRIEVFYNGEISDMTESLQLITKASDRDLSRARRAVNQTVVTGRVDAGYRVDGEPLLPNTLVIRVYITGKVALGTGDKLVFGNQLKSIVGEVVEEPIVTESGVELDAKFGSKSVGNRIVSSPIIIGTTSVLLKVLSKRATQAYRGTL